VAEQPSTGEKKPIVGSSPQVGVLASAPALDLAKVKAYDLRVVAVRGKPVAAENSPVERITDWAINSRGQLAVRVEKKQSFGYLPADLFRVDEGQPLLLLSQRPGEPKPERVVSQFNGCALDDRGRVVVATRLPDGATPDPQLWVIDERGVCAVRGSERLYEDYRSGRHGRVAFTSWERGGRLQPQITVGDDRQSSV